ncbi:MAG: type II toxin-antitoxin system VapC family toxin [Nitrospirae bacterium]|nr:type II toxin-antitoxin system VapC family toxin [Nitrospirota bacterium]
MKALDTNILVSFLVNDDQEQAERVKELFVQAESTGDRFFVPAVVLLELIWVLSAIYDHSRENILRGIHELSLMPILVFEDIEAVRQFVSESSSSGIDLPDLLIALKSRVCGCDTVLTFDKKAVRSGYFSAV